MNRKAIHIVSAVLSAWLFFMQQFGAHAERPLVTNGAGQNTSYSHSQAVTSTLLRLAPTLSAKVADMAVQATSCARRNELRGSLNSPGALAIIDYSLPSTEKRFWLFQTDQPQLLVEDFVAHGKNTGENRSQIFSNTPGSLQSSVGLFRTGAPYIGKHGISLRLIGLERGVNDLAYERAIVIHGADYVSEDFIRTHGRLGRSFGCPALAPATAKKVIETFQKDDGFLFSFYPDNRWMQNSELINGCRNQT